MNAIGLSRLVPRFTPGHLIVLAVAGAMGCTPEVPAGGGQGGSGPAGGTSAAGGSISAGGTSVTGGAGTTGGSPSTTGGVGTTGGRATGGTSTGGSATGGTSTGGRSSTGGGANGGAGNTYYLSDLCAVGTPTNAWGPIERDLSNGEQAEGDGGPLTIGNQIFSKGLGTHAPSEISFALGGNCSTFAAQVGVDDEMRSAGSVVFEVWGDGTRLYQSSVLTGTNAATAVQVDVSGVQQLRLVVSDNGGNGSDHADWADAKVTCVTQPTTACPKPTPTIAVPSGYRLVWSDEFNVEGRPNSANWSYETGFVRNEEAQWYQSANAWVQAGFLVIEGRRERLANPNYAAGSSDWKTNRQYAEYTSSSLHTRGHQSWQFGRFEMRGRIVAQAGLWPAWWTLGVAGEWPSNGEIDIMEFYNALLHANVACGTTTRWQAKWDSATKSVTSFGVADWDAKFHVWRMDWNDQQIVLSVDDLQLNTTNLSDMLNPDGQSPFRQQHYMLLNLAIGGTAGGDPSGTAFPTRYEVDYVRVFQAQ